MTDPTERASLRTYAHDMPEGKGQDILRNLAWTAQNSAERKALRTMAVTMPKPEGENVLFYLADSADFPAEYHALRREAQAMREGFHSEAISTKPQIDA